MGFQAIDWESWPRREYFEHYYREVPCTYSMTVTLDVTEIKAAGLKLYPTMLYCIATVVNRHEELRTCFAKGTLGVYDSMSPCYTVFHSDTETFSNLWTEYQEDYAAFCQAYEADLRAYGEIHRFEGKPGLPENSFTVSMIPWRTFEGFHLHLPEGNQYLLPIFTIGKYQVREGRLLLPMAIQVHHGVCDGFHVCRLTDEVQELLDLGGGLLERRKAEE